MKTIGMSDKYAGILIKKVKAGHVKVEELVKKIPMTDPKVGKVWKSARFVQEEYIKLEQDAMLAGAARRMNSSSALTTSLEGPGRLSRKHAKKG